MNIWMHAYGNVYVCVCVCVCVRVHALTHAYYVWVWVWVSVCVCVFVCVFSWVVLDKVTEGFSPLTIDQMRSHTY